MNLKISVYAENKKAKPFLPPFPASSLLALLLTPPPRRRCGPEHKHWPASASLLQLCRGPLLLLAQLRSKPGQSTSSLPLPPALGPDATVSSPSWSRHRAGHGWEKSCRSAFESFCDLACPTQPRPYKRDAPGGPLSFPQS